MIPYFFVKVARQLNFISAQQVNGFRNALSWSKPQDAEDLRVIWFHAASVGECEALFPVAEVLLQNNIELRFSVFSASAYLHLENWYNSLGSPKNLKVGPAPWDSDWRKVIPSSLQSVVTFRYEWWPGLMSSLLALAGKNDRQIQWWVVGANPTPLTRLLTRLFQNRLKVIPLWSSLYGNPREDQILKRVKSCDLSTQNAISEVLINAKSAEAPVLLVANAWFEDIHYINRCRTESNVKLLVVPHDVDADNEAQWKALLKKGDLLVYKKGMLIYFYQFFKVVFMGGGFSKSVHSFLEPRLFECEVYCGPKGIDRFPEFFSSHQNIHPLYDVNNQWLEEAQKNDFSIHSMSQSVEKKSEIIANTILRCFNEEKMKG